MLHVCVTQGVSKGEEAQSRRGVLSVGRGVACDLTLLDKRVSHTHGELYFVGSQCYYRDRLSRNGSLVRSDQFSVWLGPLIPQWPVGPGSEIVAGDSVIRVLEARPEHGGLSDLHDTGPRAMIMDGARELSQMEAGAAAAGVASFNRCLEAHPYDPTDGTQAREAVCDAFLEAYPRAACAALIELAAAPRQALRRQDVDPESIIARHRDAEQGDGAPALSVPILAEAFRRRGTVLYEVSAGRFSEPAQGSTCLCAPLWRAGEVTGFVHLRATGPKSRRFTPDDLQRLHLLASVASLVVNRALAAEEQAAAHLAACVGQILGGFARDALGPVKSLADSARDLIRACPHVAHEPKWEGLSDDVAVLRFLFGDALELVRKGRRGLEPHAAELEPVVRSAFEKCRRYFLDDDPRIAIRLAHAVPPSRTALFEGRALIHALLQCLKNAIDALKQRQRPGMVHVTCCDDPFDSERLCALNVCDDAGGIPAPIMKLVGRRLTSTKGEAGAGIGLLITTRLARAMGGTVRIASSTTSAGPCPAGTVVSLCLPKPDAPPAPHGAAEPPVLIPRRHYLDYRTRVDRPPEDPYVG